MTLRQLLAVVEIRTKLISVSTFVLATLFAAASGHELHWYLVALLAVAVLCVDMGTTAFNTFFDFVRRVDTTVSTEEPGKVLVHENVGAGHALIVSLALYLVAGAAGLAVAFLTSGWILVAGLASMLVGFLYTGGPLPISRTPLGELFAGGFLGTVLFLVVYAVHAGSVDRAAIVASLPSALIIAAVLTVNNTCDLEGDRAAGRMTLSIVLGRTAATVLVDLLCLAAWGILVAIVSDPVRRLVLKGLSFPSFPFAALPVAGAGALSSAIVLVAMHRRGYARSTKHANMASIIRVVLLFTVAYAAAVALALAA